MTTPLPDEPSPGLHPPRGIRWLLQLWFGLTLPVSRRSYAITGFTLMLVKYLVEAGAIHYYTSLLMTPLDFINPVLTMRQQLKQLEEIKKEEAKARIERNKQQVEAVQAIVFFRSGQTAYQLVPRQISHTNSTNQHV